MKPPIFVGILIALLSIATTIAAAPSIGLGQGPNFLFFELIGIRRGLAFFTTLVMALLLCAYQVLSIGISVVPGVPKWLAVLRAARTEVTTTFTELTGRPMGRTRNKQWQHVLVVVAIFVTAFAVLLSKSWNAFDNSEQVWHQALADYDVNWRTPLFSFAGNVLYNFGIQLPLNTQLLPVLGLSQFLPSDQRILAAVILLFIAMALLFWAIGTAWGLSPILRSVFAGVMALITTVPRAPRVIFSPPFTVNPFTPHFVEGLWWREETILLIATVVVFYWIGQGKSFVKNLLCSVGFALGCFLVVLGYSVGAIYFAPVIGIYCLTFLFTSTTRAEWIWKVAICSTLSNCNARG
jgi:hypothetical protein